MVKKTELPKTRRKATKGLRDTPQQDSILATIAKLDQIKPPNTKVAKAIGVFKLWLSDESGYDEAAWPHLKSALELERKRVGARRLFDA